MKTNLKFKKGDFITQDADPTSFAIFEGIQYDPASPDEDVCYSLTCYYDPYHYEQNSDGIWYNKKIFEYDLVNEMTCEYTIDKSDLDYWRVCTEREKVIILKTLADNGLAWEEDKKCLRKLKPSEKLTFGEPKVTGFGGGNVNRTPPIYGGRTAPTTVTHTKTITLKVDTNWEQKEPISSMDKTRREFVVNQCHKLKYAFNSYQSRIIYPSGGRGPIYGSRMIGMDAYSELMNGDDWGYYD